MFDPNYKMNLKKKSETIWKHLRNHDLTGLKAHFRYFFHRIRQKRNYQKWITVNRLTDKKREEIRRQIPEFSNRPLISVILPVYNIGEKWLRLCIESVIKQIYENWELCIADDCSPSPHIKKVLEEYAAKDERIKVVFRPENGHISAASNSALEIAGGEFTVLLDHDDELAEDALFYVVRELNEFPETAMIYSDEDLIGENGRRFDPKFKPDWSRDHFYSGNIVTHLSAYRTEILRKIGGFRIGLEGSQDYDLALRVIEQISENQIRHIPRVLYHWRVIKGSVSLSGEEKPYAHERAREAIRQHLERIGKKAAVSPTVYNLHRVRYELSAKPPKVSLILRADEDFDFTRVSINDFLENTSYPDFEAVLICPENIIHLCNDLSLQMSNHSIKLITTDLENPAGDFNRAVSAGGGEIICFTEINLRPAADDWLAELASFAMQDEIGAVGAKLYRTDETVLHGGLIIGTEELVGTAHSNLPRDKAGYISRAQLINNFSAVSAACLATRRDIFQKTGGFDWENLPDKFFDADYCLKLIEQNYRIVFNPYAELIQRDKNRQSSIETSATTDEKNYFARKWQKFIEHDPAYNPNFSKQDGSFSIKI